MSNKHTPGPWVIDDCEGEDHYRYIFHGEGERLETIARIDLSKHQPKRRELEANARLMAAAPDLLAALADLERLAGIASSADDPARVAARAAIAKAA